MSNELKDWISDRVQDVVIDMNLADRITRVYQDASFARFVEGVKNGDPVKFEVWFDTELLEWRCERRELS